MMEQKLLKIAAQNLCRLVGYLLESHAYRSAPLGFCLLNDSAPDLKVG